MFHTSNHGSWGGHTNHANHGNHTNYYDPNTGAPITLVWTQWPSNSITETFIYETEDKIKELRDKIAYLKTNKGFATALDVNNVWVPNNPAIDLAPVADDAFDDGDIIDDAQYDVLKNSIETLTIWITGTVQNQNTALNTSLNDGTSTGLPNKDRDELIYKSHFEQIKTKIDDLAAVDASLKYTSYHAAGGPLHNSHGNHTSVHNNVGYKLGWINYILSLGRSRW